MNRFLVLLTVLLFNNIALADEDFICARGDLERVISVVYLGDGPVPCEVRYDKGDGQAARVLWSAEHTEGYCESKAKEFVDRQEGWGYSCTHYREQAE